MADRQAPTPSQIVREGFNSVAHEYAQLEREQEWPRIRRLRDLLERVPAGGAILDLGCGSADPAGFEIAARHTPTGVDISDVQIELARRNLPTATFLRADLTEVSFAPGSFDAVVSFYAFDQVPRDRWGRLFRRVEQWLRPGGFFLLAVEDADEPGLSGRWLGVPMFFSSYDAAAATRLVEEAGLEIVSADTEKQVEVTPDGNPIEVRYTWVLAQKPGATD